MAELPKNPRRETPDSSTRTTNRQTRRVQAEVVATRRTLSKRQREERRQRHLIISVSAAIGLAVLVLFGGVIYDQLWVPSQAMAQVNSTTLNLGDYWQQRRLAIAQEIIQNFQLLALFRDNQQISGQFAGRAPVLNQQVQAIRTETPNEQLITAWQDRQLTIQGATELGVQVTDSEINQQIVQDLGAVFLPPPPVTSTTELTPTVLTDTTTLTETEAETNSILPISDATETPRPTPEASVAAVEVPKIVDDIYQRYTTELELSNVQPSLTKEDFQQALYQQYQLQVLNRKVQEALVPEEGFSASEEPDRIQARQILLQVDVPADASEEQIDEAFDERRSEAEALVRRLRQGTDFAQLAAERSDDPGSKDEGGDVGFFDKEGRSDNGATYAPAFVEAAFALQEGEISEPICTEFGWHIIEVTERDVPTPEDQLREARTDALDEWLKEQRAAGQVQRFTDATETPAIATAEPTPTVEPTFLPGPPTPLPTETPEPDATEDTSLEPELEVVTPELEVVTPEAEAPDADGTTVTPTVRRTTTPEAEAPGGDGTTVTPTVRRTTTPEVSDADGVTATPTVRRTTTPEAEAPGGDGTTVTPTVQRTTTPEAESRTATPAS